MVARMHIASCKRGDTVYQPATFTKKLSESSSLAASSEPSAGETILLVEDEAFVRDVAGEVLEYEGYRVLRARDAKEAKVLFDRHHGVVQLLLTDMVLPGQNGRDLAADLRTACPTIRTLFISGYPTNPVARSGIAADGMFYLSKPFSAESLLQMVGQVLQTSREGMPV